MTAGSRYLTGLHAPLHGDQVDFDLPIEGHIPIGLRGHYLRTGANPGRDVDPDRHHVLASAAMLHGTELRDGSVPCHRARGLSSPTLPQAMEREVLLPPGDCCAGLFGHAGQLYATAELGLPCLLSAQRGVVGLADFGTALPAGMAPHPRHDPDSGELHALAYHFEAPHLRHHRIDAQGLLLETRILPLPRPVMVHDFALTPHYLVVFDLPVLFSEDAMLAGQPLPYRWQTGAAARVGLVPRRGDVRDTRWFDMDPCWVSHAVGAWEDGDSVQVLLIQQASRFQHDCRGDDDGPRSLQRYTLDPRLDFASAEIIDASAQDLPAFDPRFAAGQRRWLWTTAQEATTDGHLNAGRQLYRHDLQRGSRSVIALPEGLLLGETTFVPAHDRAAEGQGWLLGYASRDDGEGPGEMLILDSRDPDAAPLARISLPRRMPLGSHGCWLADSSGR